MTVAYRLLGYMTERGKQAWDNSFEGANGRNEVSEEIILEYTGREDQGRYEVTVPVGAELVATPHSKPSFSVYSELSGTRIVATITWPGGQVMVRSNGVLVYQGFGQTIRSVDE